MIQRGTNDLAAKTSLSQSSRLHAPACPIHIQIARVNTAVTVAAVGLQHITRSAFPTNARMDLSVLERSDWPGRRIGAFVFNSRASADPQKQT
jgi:hypothetical protein